MNQNTPDFRSSDYKCFVLHPVISGQRKPKDSKVDPESQLQEAVGLAQAIRLNVAHAQSINLRSVKPGTFFGSGIINRYKGLVAQEDVPLVIINADIGPIQQRNLERAWKCKVIDRTGLILEIFGERARTSEGRIQVELAALTYQRSRLVRSWTHLERQRGGLGFVGGPGETQLEVDRRLIDDRISRLKKELATVVKTRDLHRKARRRVPYPIVALVGYTNAGKSTLFNRLTQASVFAKDILFATLDPTMRALKLPSGRTVILSDTVGFISNLPTTLIAAFRATLEEVIEADLLIHVRDISHPETSFQSKEVKHVLQELGLEDPKMIEVLNKIDVLSQNSLPETTSQRIAVSALTGANIDQLLQSIENKLAEDENEKRIILNLSNGAALAWLYSHGEVLNRDDHDHKTILRVRLTPANIERFRSLYKGEFKMK